MSNRIAEHLGPASEIWESRFPGAPGDELYEAGKREVDLYVRTYNTLLRSSGPVDVDVLEQAHLNIESSLHSHARERRPDMNAFMYSTLRLPPEIVSVDLILMSQSERIFARYGYREILDWPAVSAPGRRRKWHYDGDDTLAVFVASSSDLDDLVPTIVAWQLEWNKMHRLIRDDEEFRSLVMHQVETEADPESEDAQRVRAGLGIEPNDWSRLLDTWGDAFWETIGRIAAGKRDIKLQLLGGTYLGYTRATANWWAPVEELILEKRLRSRPIYFVSSNTHSLANILSGTARRRREQIVDYIETGAHPELLPELEKLHAGDVRASWDNFLYYAARLYYRDYPEERGSRDREERERGIVTLETESVIDVGAQIIDISKLDPDDLDPRIVEAFGPVPETDAIIVNINYPLGMAAYHILTQVAVTLENLQGVYVLGKAATLNARIGDIMISDVVYDEHSENTYWFDNGFSNADLEPFLIYGAALDNQRAITVRGTYLQNRGHLDFYYRENYTVAEMEAGPYLSALYEETFMNRHPSGENLNLAGIPVDIGIIHYASDTPYTRAQTLGARGLSYYGMDSTYASSLAIIRRIFERCGTGR
ncbi:MAG: DUF6909 family protein [Chloroflexota bacterium]